MIALLALVSITFAHIYWTVWIVVGFGGFEFQALYRQQPEQTLTYYFCRVFAFFPSYKGTRFWRLRRFFGLAFLAWLAFHLVGQTVGGLF